MDVLEANLEFVATKNKKYIMLIVSHRCLGFDCGENSIRGLVAAMRSPVDQIEIDLRLTSDRHYVALHFPYYFTGKGKLRWLGATTLKKIQEDNLPTLEEILAAYEREGASKQLRLEVKVPGCEADLVTELRRRGLIQSVTVVSWSRDILEKFRRADTELRLCYSIVEGFPSPAKIRRTTAIRLDLNSLCITPTFSRFSPQRISPYCADGGQVFVVGSFSTQVRAEYEKAGVAGILTKKPLSIIS